MWAPWVGHYYPAYTPDRMHTLTLNNLVAMYEFAKEKG